MCFHNTMNKKAQELAARYGKKTDIIEIAEEILTEQAHINAFTFPKCPIITKDEEIQVFNWGLIPYWIKTEQEAKEIRNRTLNARAETLFIKPAYKKPIRSNRCLIPSTGYFEWRHEGKDKTPYLLTLKNEELFSIAAIYDVWKDVKTNSSIITFSLITTEANELSAYIHNSKKRMPAIIVRRDEERWLDPSLNHPSVEELLLPIDSCLMHAVQTTVPD